MLHGTSALGQVTRKLHTIMRLLQEDDERLPVYQNATPSSPSLKPVQ